MSVVSRSRLVAALTIGLSVVPGAVWADEPAGPTYAIDVRLDPGAATLRGREVVHMWNRSAGPIGHLVLHLHANAYRDSSTLFARDRRRLTAFQDPRVEIPSAHAGGSIEVDALRVDGRATRFEVDGTVLRIPLDRALPPGQQLAFEIEFTVRIPRFADRLAVLGSNFAIGAWFPKLAVLDERGWHGGQRRGRGEFFSDAGDYDVSITVPRGFVVGATGTRIDRRAGADGTEVSRWQARRVRDFAWVADRRYRESELTWRGVVVRYLALPGHDRAAADGLKTAVGALESFSEAFGRYPYDTFTIAEGSAVGTGIGIEYPQLVLISEDLPASAGFTSGFESVLVHEVAHQWWYGVVGNDEAEEAWLDEALATYSARRFLRSKYGSEPPLIRWPKPLRFLPSPNDTAVARSMYVSQARAGLDAPINQPAAEFSDQRSYKISIYYKGAAVVEMLEYLVGTATFDQILRAYFEQYAYRNARSSDFIRTAERVSGRTLEGFFAPWLDGTGTCDYSVDTVDVREANGLYESTIRLRRRGAIVMPVVVRATLEGGALEQHGWDGRDAQAAIVIRSNRPVASVHLDPERRLFETDVENNHHPRQRRFSFNPLSMPDDAFTLAALPLAWYGGDGYGVGSAIAFGGPPSWGFPYGLRREHGGWLIVRRNLRRETNHIQLSYSTPMDRLGARGLAGATLASRPGEQSGRASMRWFIGDQFFSSPTHTVEISAAHDRQRAHPAADLDRTPFDPGQVRSVQARYVRNRLVSDFFPIRGTLIDGSIEVGLSAMGSDWTFARATVRAETYVPVTSRSKLALAVFHGLATSEAPRQRALRLFGDGRFVWGGLRHIGARRLTALNGELRTAIAGSSLAAAGFVNAGKNGSPLAGASERVLSEAGIGLRLFDNAPFAIQIDWPLWVDAGDTSSARLSSRRLVVRIGRVFDRN